MYRASDIDALHALLEDWALLESDYDRGPDSDKREMSNVIAERLRMDPDRIHEARKTRNLCAHLEQPISSLQMSRCRSVLDEALMRHLSVAVLDERRARDATRWREEGRAARPLRHDLLVLFRSELGDARQHADLSVETAQSITASEFLTIRRLRDAVAHPAPPPSAAAVEQALTTLRQLAGQRIAREESAERAARRAAKQAAEEETRRLRDEAERASEQATAAALRRAEEARVAEEQQAADSARQEAARQRRVADEGRLQQQREEQRRANEAQQRKRQEDAAAARRAAEEQRARRAAEQAMRAEQRRLERKEEARRLGSISLFVVGSVLAVWGLVVALRRLAEELSTVDALAVVAGGLAFWLIMWGRRAKPGVTTARNPSSPLPPPVVWAPPSASFPLEVPSSEAGRPVTPHSKPWDPPIEHVATGDVEPRRGQRPRQWNSPALRVFLWTAVTLLLGLVGVRVLALTAAAAPGLFLLVAAAACVKIGRRLV